MQNIHFQNILGVNIFSTKFYEIFTLVSGKENFGKNYATYSLPEYSGNANFKKHSARYSLPDNNQIFTRFRKGQFQNYLELNNLFFVGVLKKNVSLFMPAQCKGKSFSCTYNFWFLWNQFRFHNNMVNLQKCSENEAEHRIFATKWTFLIKTSDDAKIQDRTLSLLCYQAGLL